MRCSAESIRPRCSNVHKRNSDADAVIGINGTKPHTRRLDLTKDHTSCFGSAVQLSVLQYSWRLERHERRARPHQYEGSAWERKSYADAHINVNGRPDAAYLSAKGGKRETSCSEIFFFGVSVYNTVRSCLVCTVHLRIGVQ